MTLNRRKIFIFVLSIVILGCVAGLGRYAFRAAEAQTRTLALPQRWEYCTVNTITPGTGGWKAQVSHGGRIDNVDSDINGISTINRLGLEGWELVAVAHQNGNSVEYFLKRPMR